MRECNEWCLFIVIILCFSFTTCGAADALQQRIVDHLKQSVGQVIGSESTNLVLAWRGASEQASLKTVSFGVRRHPPLTADEQMREDTQQLKNDDDFGLYGHGECK